MNFKLKCTNIIYKKALIKTAYPVCLRVRSTKRFKAKKRQEKMTIEERKIIWLLFDSRAKNENSFERLNGIRLRQIGLVIESALAKKKLAKLYLLLWSILEFL